MKGKKGGLWQDYLGWVVIGIAVLVLALTAYGIITGKAIGALEFIKNLFIIRR